MKFMGDVAAFKARAVGIHLLISGGILAATILWFLYVWFPGVSYWLEGGWQGTKIMAAVDLVLGPVISLVIFHPKKSRNATIFDVVIVATIQASALIAGIYSISTQRIYGYSLDREAKAFVALRAEDFEEQDESPSDLLNIGPDYPVFVFTREPETVDEKNGARIFDVASGMPESKLYFLWDPLSDHIRDLPQFASNPSYLVSGFSSKSIELNSNLIWIRLDARFGVGAFGFNQEGQLVEQVDLSRF